MLVAGKLEGKYAVTARTYLGINHMQVSSSAFIDFLDKQFSANENRILAYGNVMRARRK